MLPGSLGEKISEALFTYGDSSPIIRISGVGGGSINHAQCLTTQKRKYFLKWNPSPLPGMFEDEAYGLKLMQHSGTVRVPQVISLGPLTETQPAFILMEWLEAGQAQDKEDQFIFGQQVALMHRNNPEINKGFGLDIANYIGSTPQLNDWNPDWISFFRDKRLGYQTQLAQKNEILPAIRRNKLEKLMDNLGKYLQASGSCQPSLLHGDLWGGNKIGAGAGFALIDPAVYYGDHEADLAFTELFGGFSSSFYRGYSDIWPIDSGYKQRKPLYNLYHLLNHLNLFGEGYGAQVDAILRHFVG